MTVVSQLPDGWGAIPLLWTPAALYVAMRRVYGESRRRTAVKFAALLASYVVASSVATTTTVLLTLLFLDG